MRCIVGLYIVPLYICLYVYACTMYVCAYVYMQVYMHVPIYIFAQMHRPINLYHYVSMCARGLTNLWEQHQPAQTCIKFSTR